MYVCFPCMGGWQKRVSCWPKTKLDGGVMWVRRMHLEFLERMYCIYRCIHISLCTPVSKSARTRLCFQMFGGGLPGQSTLRSLAALHCIETQCLLVSSMTLRLASMIFSSSAVSGVSGESCRREVYDFKPRLYTPLHQAEKLSVSFKP